MSVKSFWRILRGGSGGSPHAHQHLTGGAGRMGLGSAPRCQDRRPWAWPGRCWGSSGGAPGPPGPGPCSGGPCCDSALLSVLPQNVLQPRGSPSPSWQCSDHQTVHTVKKSQAVNPAGGGYTNSQSYTGTSGTQNTLFSGI